MQTYNAIILGPQCSGKTTIKRYLGQNFSLPLIEEDELFTELNGGTYPQDMEYKENVLRPKLNERIKDSENMIFLTSYCDPELLKGFKANGYKIIQLELDQEEFKIRNEKRMKENGYADAGVWAEQIFDFHKRMRVQGFIDKGIDVKQSVENISNQIIDFIKN